MGTSALCCAMISWEVGAEGGRSFKGSRVSAKDRWCDYLGGGWGSRWGGWAWAGAILVVRSGLGSVHIPVAHVVCGGGSGARAFLDWGWGGGGVSQSSSIQGRRRLGRHWGER